MSTHLNEQDEAAIVKEMKAITSKNLSIADDPSYLTRVRFYDELLKMGIPRRFVSIIVGNAIIDVHSSSFDTEIYNTAFEMGVKFLYELYICCLEDMSEKVFEEMCKKYEFVIPEIK